MAEGRSGATKRGRSRKGKGKQASEVATTQIVDVEQNVEAKEVSQVSSGQRTKVHRLRFLKQALHPVRCLKWDADSKRLAVSRSEGSIEIWRFHADPTRAINNACWFVERRVPGALSRKVETLVWCRGRLFAAGTSGLLLEFDAAFNVKREIPASAGGVIAMVANEQLGKIALASIDGTILVYDVENEELVYDKTLEKRTERIMSMAWHEDGNTLVTGCKGHILIWDFDSGRVQSHITLAKSLTKRKGKRGRLLQKSQLIWTVELLSDGTIVTGDSEGVLSLWDVKTATLKTQFKTHDGPILALCVSHDQQTVWCSGVDPRLVEVKRSSLDLSGWQLGHSNAICTRDVHAMTHVHLPGYSSEGVVFAGDDPRLIVTCVKRSKGVEAGILHKNKTVNTKLPPAPASVSNMIHLSRKRGVVVSRVNRGVEIWRLGAASSSDQASAAPVDSILPLESEPTKLALMPGRKGTKDYYTCAAINPNASLLCLSDHSATNLFSLTLPDTKSIDADSANAETPPLHIAKIQLPGAVLSPDLLFCDFCHHLDDELMVAVTAAGRLESIRYQVANPAQLPLQKAALHLSQDGLPTCFALRTRTRQEKADLPLAVIGFSSGRVDVVDLVNVRVLTSLPVLRGIGVSAVAISPDGAEIAAVYVNREIAFFQLDSQKTEYWPKLDDVPGPAWRGAGKPLLPIQKAVYLSSTKLLMHSDRRIHVLDRVAPVNLTLLATPSNATHDDDDSDLEDAEAKRPRLVGDAPSPPSFTFKTLPSFDVVHFVDVMDNGELVVAETTTEKVEESMPEPLLKKKYGT